MFNVQELLKLNKDHYQISQSEDPIIGFSVYVTVLKAAFAGKEDLIDPAIDEYEFEFVCSPKYPFRDPQILCHTDFTDEKVCITDNRDLYNEIIGEGGWKV